MSRSVSVSKSVTGSKSVTASQSASGTRSGVALAIGVLGTLVLIGSQTQAAEPAGKRQAGPATAAQTTSIRSMNGSHRLNRAPTPRTAYWKSVSGLEAETEVVESGRRSGSLATRPQPAAYEGKGVVTYNIVNAWPKAPGLRPGAYQLVSAGQDGQTAADRGTNTIPLESLSWGAGNGGMSAPRNPVANGGFVAAPRKPAATEAVTIAVEPIVRVSASAGPAAFESPSAQDGNTIYVSTDWVPARTGDELSDVSQVQQLDINKAR